MSPSIIAVEIGGTKLQAVLGTPEGEVIERARGHAPQSADAREILDWFVAPVRSLIEGASASGAVVSSIGVGFGGPVDSEKGLVLASHQVPGWEDFELGDWFASRFSLPTRVYNDASAAGWGEYRLGTGDDARTFCYMNIGSGIGGALVVDGRLHDGQGTGAFEIGHTLTPVETGGGGAAYERLEQVCSGWSIERRVRAGVDLTEGTPLHALCSGEADSITCAVLAEAARQGDTFSLETIETAAEHLGFAVANAITLLHPERFAIGGGVALMGEVLFEPLRRAVDENVFEQFRGSCEIVPAALAEDAVLVGALLLAGEQ